MIHYLRKLSTGIKLRYLACLLAAARRDAQPGILSSPHQSSVTLSARGILYTAVWGQVFEQSHTAAITLHLTDVCLPRV